MIEWIVIIILGILLYIFIKGGHFKQRYTIILIVVVVLFLFLSFISVIKNQNINLNTMEGLNKAANLYFVWIGHTFSNIGVLVGNAVNMDWSIQNKTSG